MQGDEELMIFVVNAIHRRVLPSLNSNAKDKHPKLILSIIGRQFMHFILFFLATKFPVWAYKKLKLMIFVAHNH